MKKSENTLFAHTHTHTCSFKNRLKQLFFRFISSLNQPIIASSRTCFGIYPTYYPGKMLSSADRVTRFGNLSGSLCHQVSRIRFCLAPSSLTAQVKHDDPFVYFSLKTKTDFSHKVRREKRRSTPSFANFSLLKTPLTCFSNIRRPLLILKSILSRRGRGVYAFTLAETLIALAIVGVVAAIVLPQVMTNINEMSWAKAKDNFDVKIDQATRQMNVNGDLPSGTGITTEAFANNLEKYIKVAKRCTSTNLTDCFVSTFKSSGGTEVTTSGLTTGASLGHSTWTQATVGLSFADGTNAIVAYDPSCAYLDWVNNEGSIYGNGGSTGKSFIPGNTTACVAIVYDINGNQKPNVVGKDIGELNAVLGSDDCVQVGSMCISKADVTYSTINTTTDKTYDSSLCGTAPKNLYCASNGWAGAVKACDNLGMRLPSNSELTALYNAAKKNQSIKNLLDMFGFYWSSSLYENASKAWYFYFYPDLDMGGLDLFNKPSPNQVRCIK
ncbi:MAG: prepilin-type N-terminal cleavage/methylation domain-containing protein [Candidatus Gastranaerophilales bacterium]|nr:prepilin-type N-terminal cleavage/methylation domain-containing protein [Candidatus Gastranaerophilales bacterium]